MWLVNVFSCSSLFLSSAPFSASFPLSNRVSHVPGCPETHKIVKDDLEHLVCFPRAEIADICHHGQTASTKPRACQARAVNNRATSPDSCSPFCFVRFGLLMFPLTNHAFGDQNPNLETNPTSANSQILKMTVRSLF